MTDYIPPPPVERWRELPGSVGRYEISDQGRLRRWYSQGVCYKEPIYNKAFVSSVGYAYYKVLIDGVGKNCAAHRLVMLVFVGPSDLDVNHKDGDKLNNHLDNLEYVTPKENIRHAIDVLGKKFGPLPGQSQPTKQDEEIRALAAAGVNQREIARRFQISQPLVSYIVSGKVRPRE